MKKNKKLFGQKGFWMSFLIVIILLLVNQWQIISLAASAGMKLMPTISLSRGGPNSVKLTGDLAKDASSVILITGMPKIYGQELGVSYIHPSQTAEMDKMMKIMGQFDPTYGGKPIKLAGDPLKRYIDIGLRISCEFCCSAKTLITQDGRAACGCAHSQAMRGLAAYLIQNHSAEYANDQILQELARWKGLYFPKQMMQKYMDQVQSGQYSPDMAALIMGLNVKAPASGSSGPAPLPTDIDLPNMSGGC